MLYVVETWIDDKYGDRNPMEWKAVWKDGRKVLKQRREELLELGRLAATADGGAAHQDGDEWILDAGTRFEVQHGPYVLVVSYSRFFVEYPADIELVNVFAGTARPVPAPAQVEHTGTRPR